MAQRDERWSIALHHVNIDGMSDAIKLNDDLMSAAVLAKAKREINELQRHKDMGGFLEKLLGK